MKRRSDYEVIRTTPEAVWLVDLDQGRMSVTNDAEAVVAEVNRAYPGRRIYYRDSAGDWDELLHNDGVFAGFSHGAPLPESV